MAVGVTATSRLIGAVAIVGSLIGAMILLAQSPVHLSGWQAALVALGVFALHYFVFWPLLVRFKPWAPFEYWLPKSRLLGYSVYLLLPVALMAALLYLAIRFGVGV